MTVSLWALVVTAVAAGVVGGLISVVGLAVYGSCYVCPSQGYVSGGISQEEEGREAVYQEAQERYREYLRRLEQGECR